MSEIPFFDKESPMKKFEIEDFNKKNFELHKDIIEAIIREAFQMFDEDGSGEIDMREFRKVIRSLGFNLNNQKIAELMQKIAKNHSGIISLEEFTEMMLTQYMNEDSPVNLHLENTFNLYDKDQDGIISREDLLKVSKEVEDILESEEALMIINFTKILCKQFDCGDNLIEGINKEEFIMLLYNLGFLEDKNAKLDIHLPKTKTNILLDNSKFTKNNSNSMRDSEVELELYEK
jgi:centrin-1